MALSESRHRSTTFPLVWYPDQERVTSKGKTLAYTDKGSLTLANASAIFQGSNTRIEIRQVSGIRLTRQQIPWCNYLLGNLPFVLVVVIALVVLYILFHNIAIETLFHTFTIEMFLNLLPCLLFIGLIAVGMIGTNLGWGGLHGGTVKLFQAMQGALTPESAA